MCVKIKPNEKFKVILSSQHERALIAPSKQPTSSQQIAAATANLSVHSTHSPHSWFVANNSQQRRPAFRLHSPSHPSTYSHSLIQFLCGEFTIPTYLPTYLFLYYFSIPSTKHMLTTDRLSCIILSFSFILIYICTVWMCGSEWIFWRSTQPFSKIHSVMFAGYNGYVASILEWLWFFFFNENHSALVKHDIPLIYPFGGDIFT